MKIQHFFFLITAVIFISCISEKEMQFNSPGAGNPLLPGYFADPTVKKFGDTYYIYSTTDGY